MSSQQLRESRVIYSETTYSTSLSNPVFHAWKFVTYKTNTGESIESNLLHLSYDQAVTLAAVLYTCDHLSSLEAAGGRMAKRPSRAVGAK